jgi:CheY-like chemotaxis protein
MPKIMVVEDEKILYELLRDLLGFEGYEVVKPNAPETLLEDMRAMRPDGLILDVYLNGVNGLDFLEGIRQDEALKDIYVLATSGMDHAQEARQRGADDFIMKPYMPDELVQLLQTRMKH